MLNLGDLGCALNALATSTGYAGRLPLTWRAFNVARAVNGCEGHFKDQEDQKTPEDPEVQTVRTLRNPTSAEGYKRL